MKNWEFYEKELKEHNIVFAMRDNQICWCSEISCNECMFHMNHPRDCNKAKTEWLYQEHKEPIVLTEDEKALCKLLDNRGWITRDKNNTLWWYEDKPKQRIDNLWCIPNSTTAFIKISACFPKCKFNFIKWEDEPWEVKVSD